MALVPAGRYVDGAQPGDMYDTVTGQIVPAAVAGRGTANVARGDNTFDPMNPMGDRSGSVREQLPDYSSLSEREARAAEAALAAKSQQTAEQAQRAAARAVGSLEEYLPQNVFTEGAHHFLDPSQVAETYADEGAIGAQERALSQLQQLSSGELTDIDRAQQMESRLQAGQFARGQREAALQGAQARGMGGSTAELAAVLGGGQAGAQRMALDDAQIRAQAQQRGLQALQAGAGLAGQIRGQGFGEATQRASAADAYNQDAIDYRRRLAERNVNRRNQFNQQDFLNRSSVRMGLGNVLGGHAAQAAQTAQASRANEAQSRAADTAAKANVVGEVIGGLANVGGSTAGYLGGR